MNNCVMCGSEIPDGQTTCSMCYGDIDYGKDGYYREWAEQQNQEEREREKKMDREIERAINEEAQRYYESLHKQQMKREIEFRGLTKDGEWVYGDLVHSFEGVHIITSSNDFKPSNNEYPELIKVIPETVGELWLYDNEETRKVYDGDILRVTFCKQRLGENLGVTEVDVTLTGVLGFDGLALVLKNIVGEAWEEHTGYASGEGDCQFIYLSDAYEDSTEAGWQIKVIGTIHDDKVKEKK